MIEISTSYYLPILLQLNLQVYMTKAKRFRFENIWIRETKRINIVKNSWNRNEEGSIFEKTKYYCLKLEEWGGGKIKELGVKINNLRRVFHQFRSRRDSYGIRRYDKA